MKNILTLTFLIFLAASCNKEAMPNEDQKHKTFRCKVNGETWTPSSSDIFTVDPFDVNYYFKEDNHLDISASSSINNQAIEVTSEILETDVENPIIYYDRVFRDFNFGSNNCIYFELDTLQKNYVKILDVDTVNYFIIGEFEYTATNDCGDRVEITDGYFDVNFTF